MKDPLGFAAALSDFTATLQAALPMLVVAGVLGFGCILVVVAATRR